MLEDDGLPTGGFYVNMPPRSGRPARSGRVPVRFLSGEVPTSDYEWVRVPRGSRGTSVGGIPDPQSGIVVELKTDPRMTAVAERVTTLAEATITPIKWMMMAIVAILAIALIVWMFRRNRRNEIEGR